MRRQHEPVPSGERVFLIAIGGTAAIGLVAYLLGMLFDVPLAAQIKWNLSGVVMGVIAVLPMAAFLWWFVDTSDPTIARFREQQIEFFADIGFEFTPFRIAVMALAAGIGEELMFRGFLQTWIDGFAPLTVAIVVTNIVFGLLHMRTVLYAVIAGLVGVYLGVLYAVTDNLLVPIVAHGVYDLIALEYTRRAIGRLKNA